MNINLHKQSQFELFSGSGDNVHPPGRAFYVFRDLMVSMDNLVVICIVCLMSWVLFFSMGVERGKKVAVAAEGDEKVISGQTEKSDIMEPSVGVSGVVEEKAHTEAAPIEPQEVLPLPEELKNAIESGYTIQVASFKTEKNAHKEATKLTSVGHDSFVVSKGTYSIVCVGKFSGKGEAKEYANKIRGQYKDYIIRNL